MSSRQCGHVNRIFDMLLSHLKLGVGTHFLNFGDDLDFFLKSWRHAENWFLYRENDLNHTTLWDAYLVVYECRYRHHQPVVAVTPDDAHRSVCLVVIPLIRFVHDDATTQVSKAPGTRINWRPTSMCRPLSKVSRRMPSTDIHCRWIYGFRYMILLTIGVALEFGKTCALCTVVFPMMD